jgi:Cof subfamily protein (haloacid dehalogenase superfamily)
MNIQAVCADIDGTLLDSQRQLSARTISSIKKLKTGFPVILASSRMPSAMTHLQRELGLVRQPLICYNGGYVIAFHEDGAPEILENITLSSTVASAIIDQVRNTDVHVSLFREDHWYAPRHDQWTDREQRITKVTATITNLDDVVRSLPGFHKIMCMGPESAIEILEHYLLETFGTGMHVYRSRPTYLELASGSVSKATGLRLLLEKKYTFGMEHVLAFGDNYNDIDLLQSVGWGVAVGNAIPGAKAVAKEVTLNSVDDGVAVAIEKYLF